MSVGGLGRRVSGLDIGGRSEVLDRWSSALLILALHASSALPRL